MKQLVTSLRTERKKNARRLLSKSIWVRLMQRRRRDMTSLLRMPVPLKRKRKLKKEATMKHHHMKVEKRRPKLKLIKTRQKLKQMRRKLKVKLALKRRKLKQHLLMVKPL